MNTCHTRVSAGLWISSALTVSTLAILSGCFHSETLSNQTDGQSDSGFTSGKLLNAKLGRGINLGNALDAPREGEWGVTLQADWFRWIADSGFSTVRIPVRWSAHALNAPPYTVDSAFLERVAWAVDRALEAKLHVIVDMHHYDSLYAHPEAETERFLALWRQIAKRFSGYPPELLLELLNEPRDGLDAEAWNTLLAKAIQSIRAIQPRRTLIVGTSPWGGFSGLKNLRLPADSNLIVTVHYYDPHPFTHQGAEFVAGANAWLGTTWRATPPQRAQVDQDIAFIRDWARENNRPIFMGEFGTYQAVDSLSRALYTEYLATAFSQAGFSWALWNFSSDFGVWNDSSHAWEGYLLDALLRPGKNAYLDSVLKATKPLDLGKYLVFDDFEGAYPGLPSSAVAWQGKIGQPPDSSHSFWYTFYSDSARISDASGTRISQWFEADSGTAPRNFGLLIGPWGYDGKGIHLRTRLKGDGYPYAGIGAGLMGGWDSSAVDLTGLTAIQFRAKGRGEWSLQVISDSIYNGYPKADNWGQMSFSFRVKDQWESFVIPAAALAPKKYSLQEARKITWEDVRNKILALEFMSGQSYGKSPDDSLELWIDEIRLVGIEKADVGL